MSSDEATARSRTAVELAAAFEALRPQLVGAAYRVLGSRTDAEDAVQETWLRWAQTDRATVRDPRTYLLTAVTRQALNRLRQQSRRREEYIGPWLPEPVATGADPAAAAELADSVSMAMLVVLESLSPLERVAFVLHDVFGLTFGEVAAALDRSEAAVRQLAHRARDHVQSRRPAAVERGRHDALVTACLERMLAGDVAGFVELLAPDVVLVSDGGGIRRAALRPIHGADKVSRWLFAVLGNPDVDAPLRVELREVNGETAMVLYAGDLVDAVGFATVEARGVTALHLVRNPDKLSHLDGTGAPGSL